MASYHQKKEKKKPKEKQRFAKMRHIVLQCNMYYAGRLANSAAEGPAVQGALTAQLCPHKNLVLDLLTDLLLPSTGQGRAGSALLRGKGQTPSAGGAGDQEKSMLRCWMAREAAASQDLRSRASIL